MKKRSKKVGLSPGALVHVGTDKNHSVSIHQFRYSADTFLEGFPKNIAELQINIPGSSQVDWVHFDGIHDTSLMKQIGEKFHFHNLILEDVVNSDQRPKLDVYADVLYLVLKMPRLDPETVRVSYEQVSLILTQTAVFSFIEDPDDLFNPVRERIRSQQGRIRKMGADYLFYALTDIIVDSHFEIIEKMGEYIEALEEAVIADPEPSNLKKLYSLKRELLYLRKSIWGSREAIAFLSRDESPLVSKEVRLYLRDVHDHLIYMMDTLETYRDIVSGILDIYLSSQSHHMNEIMKVLTIIATLFIPLTFIVGVYGMNFDNMPELHFTYGYHATWGFMLLMTVGMLFYFKKKKWLG